MFGNNLKRSVVTLAVMAGLLSIAGPAGAQGTERAGATGLKYDTDVVDYFQLNVTADGNRPRG